MTQSELMTHAENEIDAALKTYKNRIMNVVQLAWAEGKKEAETNAIVDVVKKALEKIETKQTTLPCEFTGKPVDQGLCTLCLNKLSCIRTRKYPVLECPYYNKLIDDSLFGEEGG